MAEMRTAATTGLLKSRRRAIRSLLRKSPVKPSRPGISPEEMLQCREAWPAEVPRLAVLLEGDSDDPDRVRAAVDDAN